MIKVYIRNQRREGIQLDKHPISLTQKVHFGRMQYRHALDLPTGARDLRQKFVQPLQPPLNRIPHHPGDVDAVEAVKLLNTRR